MAGTPLFLLHLTKKAVSSPLIQRGRSLLSLTEIGRLHQRITMYLQGTSGSLLNTSAVRDFYRQPGDLRPTDSSRGGGAGEKEAAPSVKPPNILVFAGDQDDLFSLVKSKLLDVLQGDRYLVYQLRSGEVTSTPWQENTRLLVVAKNPEEEQVKEALVPSAEDPLAVKVLHLSTDPLLFPEGRCLVIPSGDEQYQSRLKDSSVVAYLVDAKEAFPSVLGDILAISLGLDTVQAATTSETGVKGLTAARLLASEGDKITFVARLKEVTPSNAMKLLVWDSAKDQAPMPEPTPVLLPITVGGPEENDTLFHSPSYFSHLRTDRLGRVVLHSPVMRSSFDPFLATPGLLLHGLVVVPDRQLGGRGRGGNEWLSPEGCAMFSLQMSFSRRSPLGQHASLLCHLVSLAVVQAVRALAPEVAGGDVKIKWPNDIYYGDNLKLGGILILTSFLGDEIVAGIGVGLNLDNDLPTTSLNEVISRAGGARIGREVLLAEVFSSLETIIKLYQTGQDRDLFDLYYRYWLHGGQHVKVRVGGDAEQRSGVVEAIDEYGYLEVRMDESREVVTVQPDGNSFDMMKGLISPKMKT